MEMFMSTLAISMPGGFEWAVILLVALLLFGRRLPTLMRSLGSSVREFKKGSEEAVEAVADAKSTLQGPASKP
jgi:sec-independent protein translocase protein TatA